MVLRHGLVPQGGHGGDGGHGVAVHDVALNHSHPVTQGVQLAATHKPAENGHGAGAWNGAGVEQKSVLN